MSQSQSPGTEKSNVVFEKERLIKYFKMCLTNLSHHYTGLDTSRLTVVYFATLGLDIVGAPLEAKDRDDVISYIYSLQVSFLNKQLKDCNLAQQSGFLGSRYMGLPYHSEGHDLADYSTCNRDPSDQSTACQCSTVPVLSSYIQGHIAMTFCSILTLHALGDDFSRLNTTSILTGLRQLQQPSGAFQATSDRSECDMRFLYCACAISATLNDWTGVNTESAVEYILKCITYEGGMSLIPGNEAHGGSTYTAVASLVLMNELNRLGEERLERLTRWCLMRQNGGYNGRTNKDNDTCYSFWIGATLNLLGKFGDTHIPSTRNFILGQCQHKLLGGFAKFPGAPPDILHTFYSLCWLAMAEEHGTAYIDCRLGMADHRSSNVSCKMRNPVAVNSGQTTHPPI